jgi:hypothetical protein
MVKIARSREAAYAAAVVASVWIGCFTLWRASLLLANIYAEWGVDFPSSTVFAMELSRNYVPFVFAAVCTAGLAYLLATRREYIPSASVVILSVTLVCLAFGWFALVEPMMTSCSNFWPEWPQHWAQGFGESQLATTPGGPADDGC